MEEFHVCVIYIYIYIYTYTYIHKYVVNFMPAFSFLIYLSDHITITNLKHGITYYCQNAVSIV